MLANKRQLLGLGIGLGAGLMTAQAFAQTGAAAEPARGRRPIPHRKATTTVLFQAPKDKFVNGVASTPDGFWLIEQKETGGPNSAYKYKDGRPLEQATDLRENAWLVDDKGAVKKTVVTEGKNTSGLAYGAMAFWWGGNNSGGL